MAQSDSAVPTTSNDYLAKDFATNSPPSPSNSAMCCAYLCAHCPTASFSNMELLEQHQQHNHQQKQQHNSRTDEEQNEGDGAKEMDETESTSPPPVNSPTASSSSSSPSSESLCHQSPSGIALAALTCKKCPGGRAFASQEQLNIHYINTHRDRPQYACMQCGASFSIKRELSTHHRIHSGEQPHKCLQCGKEFGTRQLLKKHSMWHIGNRSHKCPRCGKAFFQKGHLTQHLMIHSGKRPFQCELCDKTFIFKFDLNRHLKIHQERKFACKQCTKCFGEKAALDGHRTEGKCGGGKAAGKGRTVTKRRTPTDGGTNALYSEQSKTACQNGDEQEQPAQEEGNAEEGDLSEDGTDPNPPPNAQSSLDPSATFDHHQQQQQQMAIGRVFGQLLAAHQQQQITTDQMVFPCLLCPQKFCTQAAYLWHWGSIHLRGGPGMAQPQQSNIGTAGPVMEELKPLHILAQQQQLVQNAPKEDIAGGVFHHSDTSCASSPQKASPPFSAPSVHPSDLPPSAHFLFPPVCANCELERRRATQCVHELADTRAELHRLRALLLRVGAIFGVTNCVGNGVNGAETFFGTQG